MLVGVTVLAAGGATLAGVVAAWLRRRQRRSRRAGSTSGRPLRLVVAQCEARWFLADLKLAMDGDEDAMLRVSHMLLAGYGTRRDLPAAADWMRQAWALSTYREPAASAAGGGGGGRAGPQPPDDAGGGSGRGGSSGCGGGGGGGGLQYDLLDVRDSPVPALHDAVQCTAGDDAGQQAPTAQAPHAPGAPGAPGPGINSSSNSSSSWSQSANVIVDADHGIWRQRWRRRGAAAAAEQPTRELSSAAVSAALALQHQDLLAQPQQQWREQEQEQWQQQMLQDRG